MTDDDYDAAADMAASIEECYRAIRERVANGGPPWVPPVIGEEVKQCCEMAQGLEMSGDTQARRSLPLATLPRSELGPDPGRQDRHRNDPGMSSVSADMETSRTHPASNTDGDRASAREV